MRLSVLLVMAGCASFDADRQLVPFVVTEAARLDKMMELAAIRPGDVVYDLGCGDGRINIEAAKRFGVHGLGVDIDPGLIGAANDAARAANVTSLVQFKTQDLFKLDLHPASVVMIYLLYTVNLQLRPKLFRELAVGTRVVSNTFAMGDWQPDRVVEVVTDRPHKLYYWQMPAAVGGTWLLADGSSIQLAQTFQRISGQYTATITGNSIQGDIHATLKEGKLSGTIADRAFVATRRPVNVNGSWVAKDGTLVVTNQTATWNGMPLEDFYVWGASIYFSLPGDLHLARKSVAATVDGDVMLGTTWSARRG